jgi:DNA-binding MarR family transcriptional regulator
MAVTTRTAASEAWGLMRRLFLPQRRHFMAVAAESGLSPPQMGALLALDPEAPVPMSELAGQLHCDNSNVTGIVDRLEGHGLVERRPAAYDRRVKMLAVTEAGAAVRARLAEKMDEPPAALQRLSAEDARALRDLLARALAD